LVAGHRFEQQRIQRADQHCGRRGGQEQIVENQCPFARNRREHAAGLERGGAQAEQRQRPADEDHQNSQDEHTAAGSVAKACTDVSTPERTRKVPRSENEKVRMASSTVQIFSASRFSITSAECKQRRAHQPGHEGGVFHRIPEPPAAPAELVIGPVTAHRDAGGQEHPGGQRPWPHPAGPGRVDASFDQRRDGKGEGNREADIAEIEQRRMDREADVLEDRVEVIAFQGCRDRVA
jgi:hypothetical protein